LVEFGRRERLAQQQASSSLHREIRRRERPGLVACLEERRTYAVDDKDRLSHAHLARLSLLNDLGLFPHPASLACKTPAVADPVAGGRSSDTPRSCAKSSTRTT